MLRSIKYGMSGAVLAGLIAAPVVAWGSADKTVHLVVDGKAQNVSTSASDVSEVLANRRLQLGAHDIVAPDVSSKVHSGMTIVLRHGHLLHLDVDGHRKDVWTTATTVSQALAQLGYTSADFVSVSRSRRLPLTPTGIAIRTPRPVTVVHDGSSERVSTTDVTVGQLLRDIKVTVGPKDTLSAPASSTLSAGQVVTVTRSGERTITRTVLVHYAVTNVADPSMAAGTSKKVTSGRDGSMKVTYAAAEKNGKLVATTELASTMVRKPQAEVVRIGTHTASTADAAGSMTMTVEPQPGSAKAIAAGAGTVEVQLGRGPVLLPRPDVDARERLAHRRRQPERGLRHPAGAARQQDGRLRLGLADQRHHPDHVGPALHQVALPLAVRGVVVVAGAQLVLIPAGPMTPDV